MEEPSRDSSAPEDPPSGAVPGPDVPGPDVPGPDVPGPDVPGLWAIVPAGGAGTRLWPLSRRTAPKFLHDLTGSGASLLQATVDRLGPLVGDRVVVVTGAAHEAAVRQQLPQLPADQLLVEPSPRDSMPAIGWAAAWVAQRDPEAVVGSFAADHVIGDDGAFGRCVREAAAAAREGWLVTLGIAPTAPATGFGYIRLGEPLGGPQTPTARRVAQFVEKPDAVTAAGYLASGDYRWNAGMFVSRAAVLDELLAAGHPEMARGLRAIAAEPGRLTDVWPTLTRIAIDHAVAEPAGEAGRVAVVPADFPWDDVGDFDALLSLLAREASARGEASGTVVLGPSEDVVSIESSGLVVAGSGRTVAVVGAHDLVVVDTPEAVLVVPRESAQRVKAVVDALREAGSESLL